jgi:2-hydroxy-3-keto-5-methylthiopentenyl-1-phosphate phosphatase
LMIEFPELEDRCDGCGNCKGVHVRSVQRRGFEAVLVGDGLSDRCGARAANRVWARDELWDWCRSEGIPAQRFESFADVAELARQLPRPAVPKG